MKNIHSEMAVLSKSFTEKSPNQNIDVQTVVGRYGPRHWAVYLNAQLLAVTVYKKGALAVQAALARQSSPSRMDSNSAPKHGEIAIK
jgi:hypothetical protein